MIKKIYILVFTMLLIMSCGVKEKTVDNIDNVDDIVIQTEINNLEEQIEDIDSINQENEQSEIIESEINIVNDNDNQNSLTNNEAIISDSNIISQEEISKHNNKNDCYTIINEKVYDITNFFGKHGGGDESLLNVCGIDGTQIFSEKHGNNRNIILKLERMYKGNLKK